MHSFQHRAFGTRSCIFECYTDAAGVGPHYDARFKLGCDAVVYCIDGGTGFLAASACKKYIDDPFQLTALGSCRLAMVISPYYGRLSCMLTTQVGVQGTA